MSSKLTYVFTKTREAIWDGVFAGATWNYADGYLYLVDQNSILVSDPTTSDQQEFLSGLDSGGSLNLWPGYEIGSAPQIHDPVSPTGLVANAVFDEPALGFPGKCRVDTPSNANIVLASIAANGGLDVGGFLIALHQTGQAPTLANGRPLCFSRSRLLASSLPATNQELNIPLEGLFNR